MVKTGGRKLRPKAQKLRHSQTGVKRLQYSQIDLDYLQEANPQMYKQVISLVNKACQADKSDGHKGWEFGKVSSNKEFSALNWSLYGFGLDAHNRKFLIAIQIRSYYTKASYDFPVIHKSYFLIGRNEDNTVFAHPVNGTVIYNAIRKGKDVIRAIQHWIFGADYTSIIRQGDICLVPLYKTPNNVDKDADFEPQHRVLASSHNLYCDRLIERDGYTYVLNPYLQHIPQVHKDVSHEGWARVQIGSKGKYHKQAKPTID